MNLHENPYKHWKGYILCNISLPKAMTLVSRISAFFPLNLLNSFEILYRISRQIEKHLTFWSEYFWSANCSLRFLLHSIRLLAHFLLKTHSKFNLLNYLSFHYFHSHGIGGRLGAASIGDASCRSDTWLRSVTIKNVSYTIEVYFFAFSSIHHESLNLTSCTNSDGTQCKRHISSLNIIWSIHNDNNYRSDNPTSFKGNGLRGTSPWTKRTSISTLFLKIWICFICYLLVFKITLQSLIRINVIMYLLSINETWCKTRCYICIDTFALQLNLSSLVLGRDLMHRVWVTSTQWAYNEFCLKSEYYWSYALLLSGANIHWKCPTQFHKFFGHVARQRYNPFMESMDTEPTSAQVWHQLPSGNFLRWISSWN